MIVLVKDFSFFRDNIDFDNDDIFYKFIHTYLFINSLLYFTDKYIKYITKK